MGGVLTAVAVVGAVLLTLAYPTAMLAAAVTAGLTYVLGRKLAGRTRPEIEVTDTDGGVHVRSSCD